MAQDSDKTVGEIPTGGTLDGSEKMLGYKAGTFTWSLSTIATFVQIGVATLTGTQTLTNKRITKRVDSRVDEATVIPNINSFDVIERTALSGSTTIASPTGTPTEYQELLITIKDNGGSQTLTWNAIYQNFGGSLPASTSGGKWHTLKFIYSASVYRCVYSAVQP